MDFETSAMLTTPLLFFFCRISSFRLFPARLYAGGARRQGAPELTYVVYSKHLRRRSGRGGKQGVLQVHVQVSTRVRHLSTAER